MWVVKLIKVVLECVTIPATKFTSKLDHLEDLSSEDPDEAAHRSDMCPRWESRVRLPPRAHV